MKFYKHFYVTNELKEAIEEIKVREDLKNVQILKRAVMLFQNGPTKSIPDNLKIKKRNDPNYIKRDAMFQVHIEEDIMKYVLEVAEKEDCAYSVVLYYMLSEYSKTYNLLNDNMNHSLMVQKE